ncbi:MAG TPA: N-6 DNA methylase [Tepidisphaeraceae bacterium]|jgi:type I restriction enzyme M protein
MAIHHGPAGWFENRGVAPKGAADFAFLPHGRHCLKDDGVMAIIPPHGVLFLAAE